MRARATEIADEMIAADALVTLLGGHYSPCSPHGGWELSSPRRRRALEDVRALDQRARQRRLTLVGVDAALDAFAGEAAELSPVAEADAVRSGVRLPG